MKATAFRRNQRVHPAYNSVLVERRRLLHERAAIESSCWHQNRGWACRAIGVALTLPRQESIVVKMRFGDLPIAWIPVTGSALPSHFTGSGVINS
jgi:hypothetical protein